MNKTEAKNLPARPSREQVEMAISEAAGWTVTETNPMSLDETISNFKVLAAECLHLRGELEDAKKTSDAYEEEKSHWQGRCFKAEARRERMRKALLLCREAYDGDEETEKPSWIRACIQALSDLDAGEK